MYLPRQQLSRSNINLLSSSSHLHKPPTPYLTNRNRQLSKIPVSNFLSSADKQMVTTRPYVIGSKTLLPDIIESFLMSASCVSCVSTETVIPYNL